MVLLVAAAIGAGGVAAYKGGKAAVTGTKKKIVEKKRLSAREKEKTDRLEENKSRRQGLMASANSLRQGSSSTNDTEGSKVAVPKEDHSSRMARLKKNVAPEKKKKKRFGLG
jgi:hypothetical protein|uniref:Uncharacterized protein n=1 Tax=Attheya septentrionalis TaxID=420275 RepID=A0A7S2XP00_9STRA|mmetsp:Transcript_24714/g.44757  ORF Transcript_24714/g.44757 Transcript_24714/m.44757 type:complete len:112 (+) Transcript_24714:100-435(+)|eukprot:CAMPEP_0198291752 /NCGR_PEP_ID=MMETSP1449-20131203/9177_1 /TAXON_ID=420275 /ORGANISM="Attheya septentrionalis, Strain CCMP2084" /LENGTH=111 /DNA_ID=CAMNT_0043990433 /DNA_START=95 /DNA_END=430 /DNA_ORIENTATION=+